MPLTFPSCLSPSEKRKTFSLGGQGQKVGDKVLPFAPPFALRKSKAKGRNKGNKGQGVMVYF